MKTMINYMAIFLFIIFFAYSCASNKPQTDFEATSEPTSEDIDNLFGISEDEESSTQESDEAEVLRLLGITKEESEEIPEPQTTDVESEDNLKTEITDLESQLTQKESEIANLKSEIASKDQKISELETDVTRNAKYEQYSASGDYREDYQIAFSEYNNRDYKTAINRFEALLSRDSNNSLSDNCQYWIGESYYGLGNFNQAIVEFTKVFSFNNSNKLDAAQLKLGLCYWKLGDKSKAREEFERLISNYPKSEYVEKAEYFLSRL